MTDESWVLSQAARALDEPGVASRLWAAELTQRWLKALLTLRAWWERKDASERMTWLIIGANFALVIFAAVVQTVLRVAVR